jgi:ERCC4-type nuclease
MTSVRNDADFPAQLDPMPTLIVDTREQDPLPFPRLNSVRAGLLSGDYSILGAEHHFAIERKSIADLVASVRPERERFERELHRLRGFNFARLLIVGSEDDILRGRFQSRMSPRSVLASLRAFEIRYSLPVVWEPDPESAARRVEVWACWFCYDLARSFNAVSKASQ